ncbi:MAG: AsmA family protein [Deltaproteobacteria bacterium]|nr:AsmA family protein [Deltaproteobacteria bacterium]
MPDNAWRKNGFCRLRKILSFGIITFLCILVLLAMALKIYLATPLAAAQLSRLLTARLHQPVRVAGLHTAGGALYLTGLSLGNPSGFPAGNLAAVDSIAIKPQWFEFLLGRRSFGLIALEGVRLDMLKDVKGAWNFSRLQQLLTAGKRASGETFIGQLVVKGGAFRVNGQGVKGVALQIFNLTSKGTVDSRIELAFEDAARNRYRVEGRARPGKDPALDLVLTAPTLSLDRFAGMLKLKNTPVLAGGSGQLRVKAELRQGRLRVSGDLDFSRVSLLRAQGVPPLTGRMTVVAGYNLHTDEARLETLALSVKDLIKARASGTVANLRRERRFMLELGIDQLDLGTLALFLSEDERRKVLLGGELGGRAIRLSGNGARGVTSASGSFLLRNGSLTREGRLIVSGVDGSLSLSGTENGLSAKGRLMRRQSGGKALLEIIEAPIEVGLSPRVKPLKVEIPALSARIMGVRFSGRLAYRAAAADPFSLSLRIPATSMASINPLLEGPEMRFDSGTTSLAVEAAGRGPQDFSATATARLATWQAGNDKKAIAVKQGVIDSRLSTRGGKVSASGKARLTGLALGGRTGDAACSYRFADGIVTLGDAGFRLGGVSVSIVRLAARVPVKEAGAETPRYPLSLEIGGAEIRQGEVAVSALSGTLRGSYTSGAGGSWLEGTAELASGGLSWQGRPLGAPAARLVFSRSGGKGRVGGTLLGGTLSGEIAFNPFAAEEGSAFQLGIRGGRMAMAADLLPRRGGITHADGLLEATLDGGYSRRDGLNCRFSVKGSDLALTGSAGKTLLAKGGIGLSGAVSGSNVSISDAVLSAGEGVMLKAKGHVANAFTAKREGSFSITLAETAANALIDPIANILPRHLQEATFGGAVAAEARLDLQDGRKLLDGSILLKGIGIELPSQRFTAADIRGTLPFSLDFSGGAVAGSGDALSFSRENYPRLLERFRQGGSAGPAVTVDRLRFGPLELGPLAMHVTAGNGITEITALRASLYQGELFGRGYVAAGQTLQYRGDLLVNDISLKQLCNAFPKIRGYISGRLDGIVSLFAEGSGKEGLLGFNELWTRSGSGEDMHVSKEFLQKLAGKKLRGFFFRNDRPYDQAEIKAILKGGYLTFETLEILHTTFPGIRDLSVSVAPGSNRISLERLFNAIKQAEAGGKSVSGGKAPAEAPVETEFKWLE